MPQLHKLTLEIGGKEVEQNSSATFERQVMTTGKERLLISVPPAHPDIFRQLAEILPHPYYVLYILHTPRGESEPGRYQSTELSWHDLNDFLIRYAGYFAGDARHDLWVYSPEAKRTLIWTRHNQIYAEGEPLNDIVMALVDLGFVETRIALLGSHFHNYRPEFDEDAKGVLDAFDWYRTPLRPEDEQ